MSEADKRQMFVTWASAFGMFPDERFITAAQIAVKKSPFIPSLSEMGSYLRRAELLAQARAVDECHAYKLNKDMSDPQKAAETEQFLLWLGDKPENARATAWAGVERREIGGQDNDKTN
jgi:hypothetical protein